MTVKRYMKYLYQNIRLKLLSCILYRNSLRLLWSVKDRAKCYNTDSLY